MRCFLLAWDEESPLEEAMSLSASLADRFPATSMADLASGHAICGGSAGPKSGAWLPAAGLGGGGGRAGSSGGACRRGESGTSSLPCCGLYCGDMRGGH